MRISDWSSDVCSSDLVTAPPSRKSHAKAQRGRLEQRASNLTRSPPASAGAGSELVEGPFFLSAPPEEGRCFDKLSTNGRKGDADLRLAALTALFAPLHEINRAPPSIPDRKSVV